MGKIRRSNKQPLIPPEDKRDVKEKNSVSISLSLPEKTEKKREKPLYREECSKGTNWIWIRISQEYRLFISLCRKKGEGDGYLIL